MLGRDQIALRDAILGRADPDRRIDAMFSGERNHVRSLIALHRHHFLTTMTEALAAHYPVIERLLSPESFAVLARRFIPDHPPTTSRLFEYGREFPDFLAAVDGAEPYLADVARLERACAHAAHSADDPSLDPADLRDIDEDRLSALKLSLHPSITLLSSPYALFEIWSAHQRDEVGPMPLRPKESRQYLAVGRRGSRVEVLRCDAAVFAFLTALKEGDSLADAARRGRRADPAFPIVESVAFLLSQGVFAAIERPSQPKRSSRS